MKPVIHIDAGRILIVIGHKGRKDDGGSGKNMIKAVSDSKISAGSYDQKLIYRKTVWT
jgi:hypothetical protein